MGFMNEVAAFTKGIGQKAKDNYDIVAMSGKVASINKEIRGIYTQMGEQYYALHKDDSEEALQNLVETVQNLEAQAAAIERQIENTKAVSAAPAAPAAVPSADGTHGFCDKCGAPLPPDSAFCVKCGAKVADEKENTDADKQS